MPTTLFSGRRPLVRIKDNSLNELRQMVDAVLISAICFLLMMNVMLRFPDLGSLIECYNLF